MFVKVLVFQIDKLLKTFPSLEVLEMMDSNTIFVARIKPHF